MTSTSSASSRIAALPTRSSSTPQIIYTKIRMSGIATFSGRSRGTRRIRVRGTRVRNEFRFYQLGFTFEKKVLEQVYALLEVRLGGKKAIPNDIIPRPMTATKMLIKLSGTKAIIILQSHCHCHMSMRAARRRGLVSESRHHYLQSSQQKESMSAIQESECPVADVPAIAADFLPRRETDKIKCREIDDYLAAIVYICWCNQEVLFREMDEPESEDAWQNERRFAIDCHFKSKIQNADGRKRSCARRRNIYE
jgi:hypothetical protein